MDGWMDGWMDLLRVRGTTTASGFDAVKASTMVKNWACRHFISIFSPQAALNFAEFVQILVGWKLNY